MKTITITLTLFLALLLFTQNKVQAAFVYTLDISDIEKDIGGVEFTANPSNENLEYELGDAIPFPPSGDWVFETFGGNYCAVRDESENVPMLTGRIVTITSEIQLSFEKILFFAFNGDEIDNGYFSNGFEPAPAPAPAVPIPGTLFLLGSGIIGLIGVKRKQMNK